MTSPEQMITHAFKPNAPMDDPELFAGRRDQLEQLLRALHTEGACPIILGDRGLGKTSLAIQVQRATQGDVVLLEDYGLSEAWGFEDSGHIASFFVACTDTVANFTGLLQRMVNELLSIEVVRSSSEQAELVTSKSHLRVALKVFDAGIEDSLKRENLFRKYESLDLEEQVVRISDHLTSLTGLPVLFIVDEIDRIDSKGMAAFVKAVSSDRLRFMFVGIGHSLSELIADHASLERVVYPVPVDRMKAIEIKAIVQRATDRLNEDLEVLLEVAETAMDRLVQVSGGFPWFVHVVAQEAFMLARREFVDEARQSTGVRFSPDGTTILSGGRGNKSRMVVSDRHVNQAVRELPANRFAQNFQDIYQAAVRDSYQREIVLRSLAKWSAVDIPTSESYIVARKAGVQNPSVYKGHLTQAKYGSVLVEPPYQERGMVRFRNEMFKRYVDLRPSIFEGARDIVNAAFGSK